MQAQGTRPCHPDRDCSQDRSPCAASGATVPFCSGKPGRTPEKARQGGQKKPFRNAPQVSPPQTACKTTTERKHTWATPNLAYRYPQREEDVRSLNPDLAEDRFLRRLLPAHPRHALETPAAPRTGIQKHSQSFGRSRNSHSDLTAPWARRNLRRASSWPDGPRYKLL